MATFIMCFYVLGDLLLGLNLFCTEPIPNKCENQVE